MSRFKTTALCVALLGCACDSDVIDGGTSGLATNTSSLDLGRVFIGTTARAEIALSAPGTVGIRYTTRLEGETFGYQVGPAVGAIAPNAAISIVVVFRPGREGPALARVVFQSETSATTSAAVDLRALAVAPPDCEDGNGCTVDTFNFETGECQHAVEALPCEDFNACTQGDTCVEGQCLGASFSCDDGDICTDDLCDPATGCLNRPTSMCSDNNPCTLDLCDPARGCDHRVLPDGSPCDDLEQCTRGDICLNGACVGRAIPEGFPCDDGDPCSKMDQCQAGECLDPTYEKPGVGELKFATPVGPLAEGASVNPIVDRDGTVFVGIEGGVAAVDLCGETLWSKTDLGTPAWDAAVSIPGVLSVPIGSRIVDLDSVTGLVLREVDTATLFSSTATAVRVVDLAVRASGGLVASVIAETSSTTSTSTSPRRIARALIAEIDPLHLVATPYRALPSGERARRLAIDADEAVVAILAAPEAGTERLVRFGLDGLPATSWSTNTARLAGSELALGPNGEVLWTDGLIAISRLGEARALLPRRTPARPSGSPITLGRTVFLAESLADPPGPLGAGTEPGDALFAIDLESGTVTARRPLPIPAPRMSPAVDQAGNLFLLTRDGTLHAFAPTGEVLFETPLPFDAARLEGVAVTLTPAKVAIAVANGQVIGVQIATSLANSSWPRNRRDNLSTGHR